MTLIPQLSTNIGDWGISLPALLNAALTRRVWYQMRTSYKLPPTSSLLTYSDQINSLCTIRSAAITAEHAIHQRHEEYHKELCQCGLLHRNPAKTLAVQAKLVPSDDSSPPLLPGMPPGHKNDTTTDATESGANIYFTSRAELVLRKYNPQTGTVRDVVVDLSTFRGCCCCHGPHSFKECDHQSNPQCKTIFHDNLNRLKPGLCDRRCTLLQLGDKGHCLTAATLSSTYGPGSGTPEAGSYQNSMERGRGWNTPALMTKDNQGKRVWLCPVRVLLGKPTCKPMPIAVRNRFPAALVPMFDTHREWMHRYLGMVAEFQEFDGSDLFELIKLGGAVTDPSTFDCKKAERVWSADRSHPLLDGCLLPRRNTAYSVIHTWEECFCINNPWMADHQGSRHHHQSLQHEVV